MFFDDLSVAVDFAACGLRLAPQRGVSGERRPVVQAVNFFPRPHAGIGGVQADKDRRLRPTAAQQTDQGLAFVVNPLAHFAGHVGLVVGVDARQQGGFAQTASPQVVRPRDQGCGFAFQQWDFDAQFGRRQRPMPQRSLFRSCFR